MIYSYVSFESNSKQKYTNHKMLCLVIKCVHQLLTIGTYRLNVLAHKLDPNPVEWFLLLCLFLNFILICCMCLIRSEFKCEIFAKISGIHI